MSPIHSFGPSVNRETLRVYFMSVYAGCRRGGGQETNLLGVEEFMVEIKAE